MNQTQLAARLGVERMQVSKWKARGMPVGDLGKAKIWLAKNVASRQREMKAAGDLRPLAKLTKPARPEDDQWLARLNRARANEREADRLLQSAIQGGKIGQIQPLLRAHTSAVESVANAEKLAKEAEIQGGDLVHRDSVREMMEQLLRPLREALDKLPLNERTNCNPEHPEIAERALTEWRDRLLIRCHAVKGKF
jgi:hypothetical protein